MTFLLTFQAKVISVERKRKVLRARRIHVTELDPGKEPPKGDIEFEYEDLGWFIHLEGSWESLYVGHEEPQVKPGETMVVTMRSG